VRCSILHTPLLVAFQLALCLFAPSAAFVYAQNAEPPTPQQAQATSTSQNSPRSSSKSFPVQIDAGPTALMTTPRAVETSQEDIDYAAVAGQNQADDKGRKTGEIVVAPFPISNPALGAGIVVVGAYLFPISKKDETSPSSMVGGGSFYTSNGSWLWGAGAKLYLKGDRFRLTAAYGQAQLHYDLYGIGNLAGNAGLSIPIHQGGKALLLESLIRVKSKLFLGPRYQWRDLDAQAKGEGLPPAFKIDAIELKSTTSALGFHLQHDLRDSQFYPTAGTLADVVGDFFQGTFGSEFTYQSYTFALNKYSGISPRQVVAFRIFGCATSGHVPFYDLCLLGMHNDVRGYKAGRYRDKLMLTTQAEYRLQLPKRFGLAAFFGVGEVAPELGAFNNDDLKPAGGAGIRYTLAKKNHVNLRVDYAVGLQGGGVYLGVTEAF
jgi:surface antigen Omp85-like protein